MITSQNLFCKCLHEIENNLPRTKHCFAPCGAQREIMRIRRENEKIKMGNIEKGSIALCSKGTLGMITEEEPKKVVYQDGTEALAYVGIHLTDKIADIGDPWSSREPRVIGHLNNCLNI